MTKPTLQDNLALTKMQSYLAIKIIFTELYERTSDEWQLWDWLRQDRSMSHDKE